MIVHRGALAPKLQCLPVDQRRDAQGGRVEDGVTAGLAVQDGCRIDGPGIV